MNNKIIDIEDEDDNCPLNSGVGKPTSDVDLTEDDQSDLPSLAECKFRTEQFAEITGTDTALAQFFLQDTEWNLEKAVAAYYETQGTKDSDNSVVELDAPIEVGSMVGSKICSTVAPKAFKLISWNIDGLDAVNLKKRTKAVMKIIEREEANIVLLQEVIPTVYNYMEEHMPHYMFIAAGCDNYFTVAMLLRTTVYFDGHELVEFDNSVMGRNLLIVDAHIGACKLRIMTSHLESTKDHSDARKVQLKLAFNKVSSAPEDINVIFGGDLNLRDSEVDEVGGLPNNVVDMWEATGRREEARYTWDLRRNTNKSFGKFSPRNRFDRIYLRKSSKSSAEPRTVVPTHFELVGLKKVAGTQSFPSDHWGLLTHFNVT